MVVHGPYPVSEPRVTREARAARDDSFEVDVVCMGSDGEPAEEVIDGIQIHRIRMTHVRGGGVGALVREYVGFTLAATARVARLHRKRRYGLVQVHNPPDFLVLASLVPRVFGARTILDVHDLTPEMFLSRFGARRFAGALRLALRTVERVAVAAVDEVVTVHEPYAKELSDRGVAARRITVVMNTVDEAVLPAPAATPSSHPARIVYHGTVTPVYGIDTLVRAFALVHGARPDARLEIYGGGDALPGALERAAELGVADAVEASGDYVAQEEVLRRIQGAAVGVIPNIQSPTARLGLSTKLFEYVALRIPVVCSRLETHQAHFDDDEVVFVTPGDPESFAAAILSLLEDPAGADARAEAAHARYQRDHLWVTSSRRYTDLLRRMCEA